MDLDARLAGAAERVGHAARLLLRAAASDHGLSIIQAQLLLRLAGDGGNEGGSMAMLTRWFDVSQPTISDAVTALQAKGLVTKTRRGRTQRLALTATGADVATDLAGWDRPLRDALSGHSRAVRGEVLEVLLTAIGSLQTAGVVTVARTCTTCRFFQPAAARRGEHRCALLGIPLAPADLRLDCPEHEQELVRA